MKLENSVDMRKVVQDTWADLAHEIRRTPLPHYNESVFRFMFVRSLLSRYPDVRCETEWKRMDLVFFDISGPTVVEFKFYIHNAHRDFLGRERYFKGGAGEKNFGEFCSCVAKLAQLDTHKWGRDHGAAIKNRYLLLAYADAKEMKGTRTYGHWYRRLKLPVSIAEQAHVTRVGRTGITICPATQHRLRSLLFRVTPK
ncbi:MAG: hypothetical protein ACKO38_20755 [Planctomycetota bacterium]